MRWLPPALTHSRPFSLLFASRLVSLAGTGISAVALVLLVAPRGPSAVGVLLLAQSIPRFGGPLAGAISDRLDQRRLMVLCELGQGLLIAVLAISLPPFPAVVALAAGTSALATVFAPAGRSVVPQLVRGSDTVAGYALLGTAQNLQVAVGPILGGLLVAAGGPRWALAVDAATFGVSALLLATLPPLRTTDRAAPRRSLAASSVEGLAYLARNRTLRTLALGTFLVVAFAAVDNVALVFLARDVLHVGSSGYGLLLGGYGTAMVVLSVTVAGAGRRLPAAARLLLLGVSCTGAGLVLTGAAPVFGLALAAQALAGAGNSLENVASDRLVQSSAPAPLLGRAFGGMATAAFAGQSVAYLAAGPLVALTSPRAALVVAGAGAALALPLLASGLRRAA